MDQTYGVLPSRVFVLSQRWLVLLAAFSAVSIGVLAAIVLYRRFWHPLARFPGPFFASVTNLAQCWRYLQGKEYEYYHSLHKQYGPIVRFGPNSLMVNQPKLLPVVYWRRADKSQFYNPNFGTLSLFSSLKHDDHVVLKRRIAASYSLASIRAYEPQVSECISMLVDHLKEVEEGIDLEQWLHWFAYDVISAILSGKPMGFLREKKDVRNLINSFAGVVAPLEFLGRIPKLSWLARKTWLGRRLFTAKAGDKNGIGILMTERDEWYQEHASGKSHVHETPSLMSKFIRSKSADGTPMSEYDVKAETLLAMLGGSATVSDALNKLFINLLQHPSAHERLKHEIDEKLDQDIIGRDVTFDEALSMPYLKACIRESFRLSPSTPLFPRIVPPSGVSIDGMFIPGGTALASSPWITMRDTDMYGADAEEYRPERWLEASASELAAWEKYDFHWGYGNRTCLGKHIATMEIFKSTFELVRHFDLVLDGKGRVVVRARVARKTGDSG